MFTQTVVLVVVVAGVAVAAPSDIYSATAPHSRVYSEDQPIPYNFQYGVQDEYAGTDFSQNEESNGKAVTGSYTVQLPDGRKQTVSYVADDYHGYKAEVSYYGEAQYPHEYGPAVTFKPQYSGDASHYPQPSYKSPEPSYKSPEPSYKSPEPSYKSPEPSYQPSYKSPEPSYKSPEPSYHIPPYQPSYL